MTDNKIETLKANSRRSVETVKQAICGKCVHSPVNKKPENMVGHCEGCAVIAVLEMMSKEVYNIGYAVGLIDAAFMLVKSAENMATDTERERVERLQAMGEFYREAAYEQE